MTALVAHATWILIGAFAGSLLYELYRATVKAGTSPYDSALALARQVPLYVGATGVIALLFVRFEAASWVGLAFTVAVGLTSILYYNPVVMTKRQPGIVDWLEDLVFTGALFVAAALLAYDATGWSLVR